MFLDITQDECLTRDQTIHYELSATSWSKDKAVSTNTELQFMALVKEEQRRLRGISGMIRAHSLHDAVKGRYCTQEGWLQP